jgi:hypothetical protein
MARSLFLVATIALTVGGCKPKSSDDAPAPPVITFLTAAFGVAETAGTATITVQRSGNDEAVTATYSTSAGTATAGTDYTETTGTVSWAAGDFADKTFTVTIAADAVTEGNETVNLSVSGSTAVLTISDGPGTIQFTSASFGGGEGTTATITVSRTAGNGGALGVTYATSNGTAGAADYTSSSGTLSWIDGDSADKSFTVALASDAVVDGGETVMLTLSLPTGGATIGGTNPATLTIADGPGTVLFVASASSVAEGGTATITVERVGGSGGAIGVSYATSNGTAGVSDYTSASGTLAWANGDLANKTFTVTASNDALSEGSETVVLTLSLPTGGAAIGGTNPATLTIGDGPGTLQFTAAAFNTGEGAAASITVTRVGGNGGAVSVDVATSAGSATANVDYVESSATLSWSDGDTASKTFFVTAMTDGLVETGETVVVTLSNALGGASISGTNPASLTIADSAGTLRFISGSFTVGEGGTATITVERVGGGGGAVGVTYATSNGTAGAADYTSAGGTLSWANGEVANKSFTVAITQDALVEGGETVVLTLSLPTGGASIGGTNPATLAIVDDDAAGSVQFSSAVYSVSEAGVTATITVTRTGGSSGAASVTYGDAGTGTATGADYSVTGGTLNWAAGETASKSFTVTITADGVADDNETVVLNLSGATGASLGIPSAATLTIIEAPSVTASNPANGTLGVSLAKNLRITFSKAMDAGSVQAATTLSPSPLNPLQFFWSAGGDVVTIVVDSTNPLGIEGDDLLTENTNYTLTITTGAQSATGIAMAAAFSTSFTTKVDATAPSLVSITPDPSGLLANPVTSFVLVFSEPMNQSSGTQARIKYSIGTTWAEASVGSPSATMNVAWTNATTLTITLLGSAAPLTPNRAFSLDVSGLRDLAGNYTDVEERLLVTQGADAVAPTITAKLPANGATNVSRDSGIIVAFSEAMAPDLPSHVTVTGNGGTLFEMHQETIALFILPLKAWPANATITVSIDATAKDASGNALGATSFSFTTGAGDSNPMVPDGPYSTLLDGLTSVSESGLGDWSVRFKNGVTGARALVNEQELKPEHVSVTEQATDIPLKGYTLRVDRDRGSLEIEPRWSVGIEPLANATTYLIALKPALENSMDVGVATTTFSITTAAAGANHRPKFEWAPESQVEASAAGQVVGWRIGAQNGWAPNDAGDTFTVTVTSSIDSPPYSSPLSPSGWDYTYDTPGADEANFGTPGWHTMKYTANDGAGGFTVTVQDDVYVFDAAQFPTLNTPTGAQATNTPTFTWTAVEAATQGVLVQVVDSTGKEVYLAAVAPGTTSFTLPADNALAAGSYTWKLILIRFTKEDLIRIGVVPGIGIVGPVGFSVP